MRKLLSVAMCFASMAFLAPGSINAKAQQAAQPAPVAATAVSLETKLDTKTAKVGDVFSVKLQQDATVGGNKLPSGSLLLGKITDVKPGTLVLLFDSVQIKKAAPTPQHATLAAMAGPYDTYAGGGGGSSDGSSSAPAGPGPLAMTALGSTIKGLTLTSSTTIDTSGTITSAKDFKLDKGTRMWVGLF